MKMIIVKILVVLSFISMIYINYLANSKPLNGISTGEISAKYNTLFTPSGFTFSIWGIIYILVLIFVINFVTIDKVSFASSNMTLIGLLFIISCLINMSWLFTWHFDKILLSTIVMVSFLVVLLLILHYSANTGITYITFSVYAGWVSVALIANISILLLKYDISMFMNHEWFWFYSIIGISVVIGLYMVIFNKNYLYGAVFIWAYFGILMKYLNK